MVDPKIYCYSCLFDVSCVFPLNYLTIYSLNPHTPHHHHHHIHPAHLHIHPPPHTPRPPISFSTCPSPPPSTHTQVDMSDVTSANFTRNKATFAGGAIFADEASTTISSNEYTHALAQGRFGRCFLMFGNEFNLQSVSELPISPLYILYSSTIPSPSFLTPILLVSLSLSPFFLSPPLNFFFLSSFSSSFPPSSSPFSPSPPYFIHSNTHLQIGKREIYF